MKFSRKLPAATRDDLTAGLAALDGMEWITALRPEAIRKLLDDKALQRDLFDERNLFELTHPDFPGERLVACRNPELATRRAEKRRRLLAATARELDKVCGRVARGRLQGKDKIGALDGLYVIRTSLDGQRISAEDAVRSYKQLSTVERAFRSMKTMAPHVRPIRHRRETRVRAHIFLCMLAYYVQWHMVEAWRELLFCDEDQDAKTTRDPVGPATRL